MTAVEKYPHVVSVIEAHICGEAFKVAQYEDVDSETAAEAKVRWDDWAVLYDAINDGLLDELHARYPGRRALTAAAVSL